MDAYAKWKNEKGQQLVVRVLGASKPRGAYEDGYVHVQKATAAGMHGVFSVRHDQLSGIPGELTDEELADCGLLSELSPR